MFSLKDWEKDRRWRNWTGNVKTFAREKFAPSTLQQLQEIVVSASRNGYKIRVTGAAHAFSPCARPTDLAITLHRMRGIVRVDLVAKEVTLWAGTYLHEIGPLLAGYGLALKNAPDIDAQTIAGAVTTGTHGTGVTLGSMSDQVVAWQWIDGRGKLHEHRRGDDDLSQTLHVSMGLLGILTQVTLSVTDLYGLQERNVSLQLNDGLATFEREIYAHRHLEWLLFPGTNRLQQKVLDVVEPRAMSPKQKILDALESQLLLNGAFQYLSKAVRWRPELTLTASKLTAFCIPNSTRTGYSYQVFPKPRGVKFTETEYFIDLKDFAACITYINDTLPHDLKHSHSHFPIDIRTQAGEPGFLSPTQGKTSVILSFRVYKGVDPDPLFLWLAKEMQQFNARPHWGKGVVYDHRLIHHLYPNLDRFLAVRSHFDPEQLFVNHWLKRIFNI